MLCERASERASGLVKCQLKLEVAVVLRTRGEEWAWREVFRTKGKQVLYMLENCALLGFYEAYDGYSLPTFRDNLSAPYSRVEQSGLWTALPVKMAPTGCHGTPVTNYESTFSNISQERRSP